MNSRAVKDITDFIFISDTPQKSDVILIPGTSRHEVTERAAELWHNGFAPYVLPSGRFSLTTGRFMYENVTKPEYQGNYITEFEYCKHILMVNGVPENAILVEDKSTNTAENAAFSVQVLKENNIDVKRAILCCQAYHARRAFMTYSRYFGDVEFVVVPTETQGIRCADWYKEERPFKKVMKEVEKCGKYFSDFRNT